MKYQNLTIDQGATFRWSWRWTDARKQGLIVASDTVKLQIKATQALDATLVLDCTQYLTIDVPNSNIKMLIPASITKNLSFATAYYDLLLVRASGEIRRLSGGIVTLSKGVTSGN